MTHFAGFSLVFKFKVHTNVGPRSRVLYRGQLYMLRRSCLSTGMALTKMTGMVGVSSFSRASWIVPVWTSQRAPSMNKPHTYAPSRGGALKSSRFFFVTSHWRHILSSGHSFLRAIDCMMAVRKDWGLKKPPSQMAAGIWKSEVQLSSCLILSSRSANQPVRLAREG